MFAPSGDVDAGPQKGEVAYEEVPTARGALRGRRRARGLRIVEQELEQNHHLELRLDWRFRVVREQELRQRVTRQGRRLPRWLGAVVRFHEQLRPDRRVPRKRMGALRE